MTILDTLAAAIAAILGICVYSTRWQDRLIAGLVLVTVIVVVAAAIWA